MFDRLVLTAARVLKCDLAVAQLCDGDTYSPAAGANAKGLLTDLDPLSRVPIDATANFPSRAILGKTMLHLPDWSQIDLPPHELAVQDRIGVNSSLYLPLLREGECVGVLTLGATRPNNFGPKEIAQAESFRDQALIAIENARMFRETQEALEQQRASAEILGVISKSVADAQPVFDKILESCKQLFDGDELDVLLVDDEGLLQVAAYLGNARDTVMATFPAPWEITPAGRAIRERRVANYSDVLNNPDTPPVLRKVGKIVGYHSVAFAPMVWEDKGIGAVGVARSRGAFTEKEMALLQTFADQAVIAIQNARMFNETKQALERQTATAEVLKVIASSPSDVQPVFDAIAASANRLLGGFSTTVIRFVGDALHLVAFTPTNPTADEALQAAFPRPIVDFPPFLLVRDGET